MEFRENVLKYVIGTDHLYSEVRHNVPVTNCRYLPVQRPAVSRHKRHVRPTAQVAPQRFPSQLASPLAVLPYGACPAPE